jgi:hypothetical protein
VKDLGTRFLKSKGGKVKNSEFIENKPAYSTLTSDKA